MKRMRNFVGMFALLSVFTTPLPVIAMFDSFTHELYSSEDEMTGIWATERVTEVTEVENKGDKTGDLGKKDDVEALEDRAANNIPGDRNDANPAQENEEVTSSDESDEREDQDASQESEEEEFINYGPISIYDSDAQAYGASLTYAWESMEFRAWAATVWQTRACKYLRTIVGAGACLYMLWFVWDGATEYCANEVVDVVSQHTLCPVVSWGNSFASACCGVVTSNLSWLKESALAFKEKAIAFKDNIACNTQVCNLPECPGCPVQLQWPAGLAEGVYTCEYVNVTGYEAWSCTADAAPVGN